MSEFKYKYLNYREFSLVPIVHDIVRGNVNGRTSASLLFQTFQSDSEINKKKETIEWWVKTITLGEVRGVPGGFCGYSKEFQLLVLNESRENWQSNQMGERDRMYAIGKACEQQGVVYRYLPKAASDESTVLILALPNPTWIMQALKQQKEGLGCGVERQIKEVMTRTVEEHSLPEKIAPTHVEKIVTTTVRRGIIRKPTKEVDLKELEENFQSDDE
jgi:hypothetical protein